MNEKEPSIFSKEVGRQSLEDFLDEFDKETDRAAVVLGAARLDNILYRLLKKALLPSANNRDELLEGEGAPVSTFSARIQLAYRLGLFDAQTAHLLHLIRKIRNDFAHETSSSSLESGPSADRVRELVMPFRNYEQFHNWKDLTLKKHKPMSAGFRTVLAILAFRLEGSIIFTNCLSIAAPRPLIPTKWNEKEEPSS
jgi:hypothetical protein